MDQTGPKSVLADVVIVVFVALALVVGPLSLLFLLFLVFLLVLLLLLLLLPSSWSLSRVALLVREIRLLVNCKDD